MMRRDAKVGTLYAIPDPGYGWYFGCLGAGGDILFADHVAQSPNPSTKIDKFFLRIFISYASIKRAGWVKIGKIPPNNEMLTYSKYRRTPVGSQITYISDTYDGSQTPATKGEADHLEISAVWDAQEHMIPILRYHFFREIGEATAFLLKKITAKI